MAWKIWAYWNLVGLPVVLPFFLISALGYVDRIKIKEVHKDA